MSKDFKLILSAYRFYRDKHKLIKVPTSSLREYEIIPDWVWQLDEDHWIVTEYKKHRQTMSVNW
jgi:hypothetical protein